VTIGARDCIRPVCEKGSLFCQQGDVAMENHSISFFGECEAHHSIIDKDAPLIGAVPQSAVIGGRNWM
jgi:hypothetical protein